MKNKVLFETSNKAFSEIIGNSKKYMVPKYQRDYSWDEEQWQDLWQDIVDIDSQKAEDREQHYMGYLVLQKQDINQFRIIDGQQRLTTLSLLILAALQILKASKDPQDSKRLDLIKTTYISSTSPSSLTEDYKLQLNRNNDEYYRNDLANLNDHPRQRNIKKTEHQMRKAKNYYAKAIDDLKLDGSQLSKFIDNIIANYLLFTVIVVGDDINAYKIFETLNARGVHLSTPDLLKNYLFSIIDPNYESHRDIEAQEEKWAITLDNLGSEDFAKFLRCFWNSRNTLASKTNLYKKITDRYKTKADAVSVLDVLKEQSNIYAALKSHKDKQWTNISNEKSRKAISNCLLALEVFSIFQPYPILLSAYFAYSEKDFARICEWLHTFCMRYQVICRLPSNEVEKWYNQIAIKIYNKATITEIKQMFLQKLPSNEKFKQAFGIKDLTASKLSKKAHFILASIENNISHNNPINLTATGYSIEHILPQNPDADDEYWREQFQDLLEQNIYRLGNLTLLTERDNQECANLPFSDKKNIYQNSNLELLKKICDYDDWNADSVNDYQNFLATKAVAVWAID